MGGRGWGRGGGGRKPEKGEDVSLHPEAHVNTEVKGLLQRQIGKAVKRNLTPNPYIHPHINVKT